MMVFVHTYVEYPFHATHPSTLHGMVNYCQLIINGDGTL